MKYMSHRPFHIRLASYFILCLLCLHPYIQIFKYVDFCLHKEQVVIHETICEDIVWVDDNSYYDGVDYINFSIGTSFKKKMVASFNAHTLVFKDNHYIGYINSDFTRNNQQTQTNVTQSSFEPNSTEKLYFHISHPTNTSWQNHELFKEIYEGNMDDFHFITNIICVYFEDGTMVGHYLFLPSDFYYDENGVIHFKDKESNSNKYYYYDENGRKHYD